MRLCWRPRVQEQNRAAGAAAVSRADSTRLCAARQSQRAPARIGSARARRASVRAAPARGWRSGAPILSHGFRAVSLFAARYRTKRGLTVRSCLPHNQFVSRATTLNRKRKTRLRDGRMKGQAPELDEFGFNSPRRSDFANLRRVTPPTRARAGLARFAGVLWMIDARQRRILFQTTAIAVLALATAPSARADLPAECLGQTTCSPLREAPAPLPASINRPRHSGSPRQYCRPLRCGGSIDCLRRGQHHGERRQQLLCGLERGRGLPDQFVCPVTITTSGGGSYGFFASDGGRSRQGRSGRRTS